MKKIYYFLFAIPLFVNAQINTSTGGANNVNANMPTSNTNVGIGTNNPQNKLQVIGDIGASQGIFTTFQPDGGTYASGLDRNDKCVTLSVGTLIGSGTGYLNTRMFNFFDFPVSNIDEKSNVVFGLEDRADVGRYRYNYTTGGRTEMIMLNKSQQEFFKVFEDGSDNVYMHLPNPNSRIVIAGMGNYLPEHKFVVRGSSKIEGNILTDSNIGIGTSNFVEGVDNYRLSVNGAIRAHRVKVYTTWADYVFESNYNLPTLKEVEQHIKDKGHLIDIPSAKEVDANGIDLGEMNKMLLQKIEELTLYVIDLNKKIETITIELNTKKNE